MAEQVNRINEQEQDLKQILKVRRDKLKALQDAGMDPFTITKYDVTYHAQEIKDNFDALEGQTVSVGGRLMSKRGMGKVSFCDLQDKSGRIQSTPAGTRWTRTNIIASRSTTSATSSVLRAPCSARKRAR